MPWGLVRYQQARSLHFITFSCYRRSTWLNTPDACRVFEETLERVRRWYGSYVSGYVVMPEHVHLLISEPERGTLAIAIQMLKQITAHRLRRAGRPRFWQARYYDFNVRSEEKFRQKLRYMHRNPVTRGLVDRPEQWEWSSFRHYLTGMEGVVEIESEWTGRRREAMGIVPQVRMNDGTSPPCFSKERKNKDGAPSRVK